MILRRPRDKKVYMGRRNLLFEVITQGNWWYYVVPNTKRVWQGRRYL